MSERGHAEWELYRSIDSIVAMVKETVECHEHVKGWSYLEPVRLKTLARYLHEVADEMERYVTNCEKRRWKDE